MGHATRGMWHEREQLIWQVYIILHVYTSWYTPYVCWLLAHDGHDTQMLIAHAMRCPYLVAPVNLHKGLTCKQLYAVSSACHGGGANGQRFFPLLALNAGRFILKFRNSSKPNGWLTSTRSNFVGNAAKLRWLSRADQLGVQTGMAAPVFTQI